MQTELADFIKDTPEGREAEAILRKCVHCGFCTATCPTYQLLGDELDGPRKPGVVAIHGRSRGAFDERGQPGDTGKTGEVRLMRRSRGFVGECRLRRGRHQDRTMALDGGDQRGFGFGEHSPVFG